MLIAKCNGYRTMTPSAFRLVPFKPRFHAVIFCASGHVISWGNEGDPVRHIGSYDFTPLPLLNISGCESCPFPL